MYGIIANVVSDRVLRTGAKVRVLRCNGDASCPIVMGLNKSGRTVTKYTHYKRLTNFRAAWIPDHLSNKTSMCWEDKDKAASVASDIGKMWSGVRFYSRDGSTLLQDGKPESEAFLANV